MTLVIFALLSLSVLVILNFLLTFALIRRVNRIDSVGSIEPLDIGEKAPPFETKTLEGKMISSGNLLSQSFLMVFMSPNCSPCASKIDEIADLVPRVRAAQKDLLLVSNGSVTEAQEFFASARTLDPLLDTQSNSSIWRDYKVPGTPFFYIVNDRRQVSASGFIGTDFALKVETWLNSADYNG